MKSSLAILALVLSAASCSAPPTPIGSRRAPPQDSAEANAPPGAAQPGAAQPTPAPPRAGIEQFPGSKIFMPPQTPAPGIVMLHGSEGGTEPFLPDFAAELAREGFVVVSLCWFGCPGTPDRVLRVPLDQVRAAGRWLMESPEVSGTGVGLFGWSRGGEAAVLVTSLIQTTTPFRAVAVHAPSDTVVASFDPKTQDSVFEADATGKTIPAPAWTWEGAALFGEPTSDFRVPGPRIAVEKFAGPMYVSAGEQDEVWEAARSRRIVSARNAVAGLVTESHFWPGEGHVLKAASSAKQHAEIASFFKRTLAP